MVKRIVIISSLLFLCAFTNALGAENIAIQGGNILTISGDVIEHGTILIKDGKVEALGRDVVIPSDTRTIDAKDKFVMPGRIDAQSRLYVIESELNESRAIAPDLNILDALDPFIKEYQEVLAQGVTTIYVTPGSHSLLGGRGAVLKLNGSKTANKMVLKADVAIKGVIGISSNNQSSSLRRLEHYSSVREALIATQAYIQEKRKYEQELSEYKKKKADKQKKDDEQEKGKKDDEQEKGKKEKPKRPAKPKRNPTYEILAKVLRKEIPLQIEAHRVDDILNALRLADEFDFTLILDKCTEGYMIADEIARRKVPVIVGPVSTSFVDMPKLEYRNHDMRNAAILSKEGVKLALGVSGRDGASSKFIALAAAMAVANGMDKDIALRAITLTPAEILGVADRIGSLEAGKDADIVILSGHPLDTFTQVEMVLIEGKTVYERKTAQ
ncbi:MAG: amidohydrolase family protein [Planctomycetota bacterium]